MSYSTPQDSEVNTENKNTIIEAVKPDLLIGISTYTQELSDDTEHLLDLRFSSCKDKRCELCGVSINEDFRKKLNIGKAWFNTCGMCYYTSNLDLIPNDKKGNIVYYPRLSQERMNALVRVIWCLDHMCALEPNNEELNEYKQVVSELDGMLQVQREVTKGFIGVGDVDVYGTMMHLLTPEEYKQRYKVFSNFRWQPEKKVFTNEIAFWVEKNYKNIHPDNIIGNIKDFMARYVPGLDLRE